MKKILLSILGLLSFVFIQAQEATLSFDDTANRTVISDDQQVWEQNGIILTNNKSASTNKVADYAKPARFYKGSEIIIECSLGNITSIVFDCNNASYATALNNSITGASVSSDKVTVTLDGSSNRFTIATLSAQVRMDAVTVTYGASDPNAVYPPKITPNGGEYVEGDKVEVTITGGAGQDVYYALNSEDVGDAGEYTGSIEVTSNVTVYAWASDGTNISEAASATFNFTAPLGNIAAFNALDKGKAAKFIYPMTVVYQSANNNLIVKDDSGTMLIYGSVGQTYNNGDVIAAGVRGYVSEYGGNKQLNPTADSFTAGVAGTAVTPVVKAVTDLSSCAFLDYVKLEGVYFTLDEGKTKNYTVSDGSNTFAAYNQFGLTIEGLEADKTYNVEGFMSSYNGTKQFQPTKITTSDGGEVGPGENPGTQVPDNLGTKDAPITVAQAIAAYVNGETKAAWVTGYIVGSLNGSKDKPVFAAGTAEGVAATNLLIADAADCTEVSLCIPVQLPTGTVRAGLNLKDNPSNLGKQVVLNGNITAYFMVAGLKETTEYEFVSATAIEEVGTDVNAPVEYYNLQGVKVTNPENGIFIKKQGAKAVKVVL